MPDRRQPAEELNSGGNYDHQTCGREKAFTQLRQPGGKHVMHPHSESNEPRCHYGDNDWRMTENPATREAVDERRDDCRPGQGDAVDLGRTEESADMLVPKNVG